MTNREFANDRLFVEACRLASVPPSARQASKFRAGYGKAAMFRAAASEILSLNGLTHSPPNGNNGFVDTESHRIASLS